MNLFKTDNSYREEISEILSVRGVIYALLNKRYVIAASPFLFVKKITKISPSLQ